jgi:hypothetical protein
MDLWNIDGLYKATDLSGRERAGIWVDERKLGLIAHRQQSECSGKTKGNNSEEFHCGRMEMAKGESKGQVLFELKTRPLVFEI